MIRAMSGGSGCLIHVMRSHLNGATNRPAATARTWYIGGLITIWSLAKPMTKAPKWLLWRGNDSRFGALSEG